MEHFITCNGTKIWTDICGNRKKGYIILCNGGPGSCDYLKPVSEMMEDGYQVIRFEQRGCGRSDADGKYDLDTAIQDIEAIRVYYGIERWIVGGHSWGANLALIYAMRYPEHTEAVLYIAGNGLQRNREWSALYHANREKYGEEMPDMQYPANDEVNKQGNRCYQEFIQQPSLYKDIAGLKMKILFLCAKQDIRPDWPARQLCSLVRNGEIAFIEGAGHYMWLQNPTDMRSALRRFLKVD